MSLGRQSVCKPTVVVMETGGSLLVVILEWVYRGSVCVEWWYGTLEMDACGRVELKGSVCLE